MKSLHALVGLFVLLLSVSSSSAVTLHATDDTNVNLATPTQINGASVDVFVRNVGTGGERHGYVKFDTSLIAQNTPIEQAQLRLWVSAVSTAGPVDFHVVTSPWDEATLNAGSQPSREPTPFTTKTIPAEDASSFVIIDVTAVVRDWVNGTKQNFGIALVPNPAGVRVTLNSKENASTSHPMELEIALAVPRNISVRVSKAEPQTIQHMTGGGPAFYTAIGFPSERWDTDNMHCNGTPTDPCTPPGTPSRLTANTPGTYLVVGNVEWAPNTSGIRLLGIRLDGNINIAQVSQDPVADPTLGSTAQSVSTIWQLSAGQYVELVVRQTSGTPLDVVYNPIYSQEFGMVKMP